MSSSSIPHGVDESSETPRQALPSFEPVNPRPDSRDGRPESSVSGSKRSRSHGGSKSSERLPDRNSPSSTPTRTPEIKTNGDRRQSRRTSQRSSGGFLLGSIGPSSRIPRLSAISPEDPKGKRKSEDGGLSIPKRRARNVQAQSRSSLTSSPLATEVRPENVQQREGENGNGRLIPGTDIRHSTSSTRPITMSSTGSSGQHLEIKRPTPPSFGYDTDPSQIVSMALSLGEARRRQASVRRSVSTDQHGKRVISTASSAGDRSRIPTGSISQRLTPNRPVSVSLSSNARPETPHSAGQEQTGSPSSPEDAMDIDGADEWHEPQMSDATAARVQRARTFFELAYEHRRLLTHLPPIRRPGMISKSNDPDSYTKAYNPLQYIRNRKLRIWDKTTFNAEAEDWHDVDKVKKWVDTVLDSHRETRHDPSEIVRLPLLSHAESYMSDKNANGTNDQAPMPPIEPPKPRRPRSDWVTHPGDMLADCFWMEQGMNKIKIKDRDNNQIYPPDTQFRFSGWRNRTPVDVPLNLQQPTPPPDDDDYDEEGRRGSQSPAPELPTFKSAHHTDDRGIYRRKKSKLKASLAARKDESGQRKGLKLFMDDTSDGSGSDRSPGASDGEKQRGRKRSSRKRLQKHSSSRSPGADPLTTTQTKDSIFTSSNERSTPSTAPNSNRASIDHSRFGRYLHRGHHGRQESSTKFPSFHDQPRTSGEYESTAPSSPTANTWPSIAINLESPPHSRSPSPSKKKSSILNPFRDRSQARNERIDATDFADLSQANSRQTSGEDKHHSDVSPTASRGTSPMTRGTSPLSKRVSQSKPVDVVPVEADRHGSTVSRISSKSAGPPNDHGKIRGFFKGGRIAEIVGNEVSRVGEFVWKRDIPAGYRRRGSTSTASTLSHNDSDYEDTGHVNGDVYKTPKRPRMRSRRASTISSTKGEEFTSPVSSKSPPSGERPKYNNPNLPSFTSPFERDKESQDQKQQTLLTPTISPENRDHIARLAAEHRSASRSPRLNKLAPPKLDTGATPSGIERMDSYGFGESLGRTRSQDASDRYNEAIKEVGPGASRAMMTSGLAEASVKPEDAEPENVTRRDIDRASALLICSAVKAREIGRRAELPRRQPSKYLLETMAADGEAHPHIDLSLVSRREEHVVAARIIMSRLSTQAAAFDDKMKRFSATTVPALHMELQTMEDVVENKMTPRVRKSADEAGELSMKLSSTSTLAVKGLNDAIDLAFRRRRRGPIRWVRRLWYISIEYAVVSLLWGIWAVVTLIRVFLAIFTGTINVIRWLLWID